MLRLILAAALMLTCSCSTFEKINRTAENLVVISTELKKVTDGLAAADTDKDGLLSTNELIAWVGAGGGALLIGLWKAFGKISSAKEAIWGSINEVKEKVAKAGVPT